MLQNKQGFRIQLKCSSCFRSFQLARPKKKEDPRVRRGWRAFKNFHGFFSFFFIFFHFFSGPIFRNFFAERSSPSRFLGSALKVEGERVPLRPAADDEGSSRPWRSGEGGPPDTTLRSMKAKRAQTLQFFENLPANIALPLVCSLRRVYT